MGNEAASTDPILPVSDSKPAADPAKLEQVIDDVPPAVPYVEWAVHEMTIGRSAAAILKDLIAEGWSAEEAEAITEEARLATRHLRGGVTRERIARASEREYRDTMTKARTMGIFGGLGLIFGTAATALSAIFRSSALKSPKPKFVEEEEPEGVDPETAAARLEEVATPATATSSAAGHLVPEADQPAITPPSEDGSVTRSDQSE
jgi:hypothetical protein